MTFEAGASGGSGLSKEQLQNAALIYQIGKRMGMSNRDIQIGLITAMQESGLRNLNYGDRDSLGLFQQRPSQGWGSVEQVTNPTYAATKFFTELKKVGNRNSLSMTQAAQAVQRSAYPDAYAKHIPMVRDLWPRLTDAPLSGRESRPSRGLVADDPVDEWQSGVSGSPLVAGWNPLLSAPDFWAEPDPAALYGVTGDFLSPLGPQASQFLEDADAVAGFTPRKGVNGWRAAVLEIGRKYVGTPYKWGGTDPSGFDCSGLLQYVYSKAGIDLPRVSFQQANYGKKVGLSNLRPGDLVAWDNSSRNNGADHIAMYLGNGRILEAPAPGKRVRIRKLDHNEGAWGVRIDG